MNELEKVSENIKSKAISELTSVMDNIYNETVVNFKKSTIPEVVFVEYFLDFFRSGMSTPDKDLKYAKWIELSKSPYNEVDVIDNLGNLIFTVPPLFSKPVLDPSIIDINFSNIGSTYILKSNRMQEEADNYLSNELNPVAKMVHDNTALLVQRWELIFNRYVLPVASEPILNSVPFLNTNNIEDDDIDY